jgi:hypothetical protein
MALDAKVKKLLNDFSKSQPALNETGKPAAISGLKIGDLIEEAMDAADSAAAAAAAAEAYAATTPADWAGSAPTSVAEAIDRLAAATPGA